MDEYSQYKIDILTIFPEFFESPLQTSLTRKAIEKGAFDVTLSDIRDFAHDKHNTTDDIPYGGGAGMVMKPEPVVAALEYARRQNPELPRIMMTPQGEPFSQKIAQELASLPGMILVCGRYEGIDERVREGWIDRELSIGDYILTGGEFGALVVMDAVTRLLPGVLGNRNSIDDESFTQNLLEYPQYTRPRVFRDREVPPVLLSGHHEEIAKWRKAQALQRTQLRRPDLLDRKP